MARFHLHQIEEAASKIDPVFLHSPQYECDALSKELNTRVVLKIETQNPIRSFKGRGADLLVSQANEPLVCASAGNFGQAMAYACRKWKLPLKIFASINANSFKVKRMKELGGSVILKGMDFDEAKKIAREEAILSGHRFVEDSLDIETAIGAGTIGLELLQYVDAIDAVLIPIGNGALINGVGKVFKEKKAYSKIVGVQAAGAPAMIESWQQGKRITYNSIQTIADGIGVRLPVAEALTDMEEILDEGILVEEKTIIVAMQLLWQKCGVLAEPSAAVGIAALLENPERFKNKSVVVIICGSNLTQEQTTKWLYI
jgi:threonine dehydratase